MTVRESRRSHHGDSTASPSTSPSLSAISDAAAALHCEHFRRGPRSIRSYVTDDLVVCVLSGILTPAERTLVDAGEADQVRWRRAIHQVSFEETYARRMATTMGRPVSFYLDTVSIELDIAVYIFTTDPKQVGDLPDLPFRDPDTRSAC
jgi:uncharacterized protein YbcI